MKIGTFGVAVGTLLMGALLLAAALVGSTSGHMSVRADDNPLPGAVSITTI